MANFAQIDSQPGNITVLGGFNNVTTSKSDKHRNSDSCLVSKSQFLFNKAFQSLTCLYLATLDIQRRFLQPCLLHYFLLWTFQFGVGAGSEDLYSFSFVISFSPIFNSYFHYLYFFVIKFVICICIPLICNL